MLALPCQIASASIRTAEQSELNRSPPRPQSGGSCSAKGMALPLFGVDGCKKNSEQKLCVFKSCYRFENANFFLKDQEFEKSCIFKSWNRLKKVKRKKKENKICIFKSCYRFETVNFFESFGGYNFWEKKLHF